MNRPVPEHVAARLKQLTTGAFALHRAATDMRVKVLPNEGLKFPDALCIELEHLQFSLTQLEVLLSARFLEAIES